MGRVFYIVLENKSCDARYSPPAPIIIITLGFPKVCWLPVSKDHLWIHFLIQSPSDDCLILLWPNREGNGRIRLSPGVNFCLGRDQAQEERSSERSHGCQGSGHTVVHSHRKLKDIRPEPSPKQEHALSELEGDSGVLV